MKGLLLKDLYCLKKQLRFFVRITISVILFGILFVLSAKYGNVARAFAHQSVTKTGEMITYQVIMVLILFIPIALGERVTECFLADYKAHFGKVYFVLPIDSWGKVGSRYIVTLLFVLLGTMCSFFAGCMLVLLSEQFQFLMICRIVVTLCMFMIIFMSIVLCGNYFLGGKNSSKISTVLFVVLLASGYGIVIFESVKGNEEAFFKKFYELFERWLNHAGVGLVGICVLAVFCMALSYVLSVLSLRRKKGDL